MPTPSASAFFINSRSLRAQRPAPSRRMVTASLLGMSVGGKIGVARCDYFLKQLAKQSYNRARQARVVLRLALGLAVRHEILPRNPMDHVSRLRRPTRSPDVFTWDEITGIRAAIGSAEG